MRPTSRRLLCILIAVLASCGTASSLWAQTSMVQVEGMSGYNDAMARLDFATASCLALRMWRSADTGRGSTSPNTAQLAYNAAYATLAAGLNPQDAQRAANQAVELAPIAGDHYGLAAARILEAGAALRVVAGRRQGQWGREGNVRALASALEQLLRAGEAYRLEAYRNSLINQILAEAAMTATLPETSLLAFDLGTLVLAVVDGDDEASGQWRGKAHTARSLAILARGHPSNVYQEIDAARRAIGPLRSDNRQMWGQASAIRGWMQAQYRVALATTRTHEGAGSANDQAASLAFEQSLFNYPAQCEGHRPKMQLGPNIERAYPSAAIAQELNGAVSLEVEVAPPPDGRVARVEVLGSHPHAIFEAAAVAAVLEARFEPLEPAYQQCRFHYMTMTFMTS